MIFQFSDLILHGILILSATDFVEGHLLSAAKREDTLEVISPIAGDTLVAGAYWDIKWKPSSSTDKNVTISLRQGPQDYTQLVHVIAGEFSKQEILWNQPVLIMFSASTLNNGSYLWRSRDDDYLRGTYSLDRPDSGCNYSMEFRTAGIVASSQPFTLINAVDGGIQPNMSCAGPRLDYSCMRFPAVHSCPHF